MPELASSPGICLPFPLFSLLDQTVYDYASLASDTSKWEQANMATWGALDSCPLLTQFQGVEKTRVDLSAISHAEAWGKPKRSMSDVAYLLLAPNQVVEEERRFGLVAMWTHPCQGCLPWLDEAVRKLTLLINNGEDLAYALMQLNEDSQHIPLSTAGHINAMINGAPSRSACGHRSHLEVCKLLQCGVEVVYPEGLSGGLELLQVFLPKLPIWDWDSNVEFAQKPLLLQVNLPRIVPQQSSTPIPSPHSVMECPSDLVSHPSMTMEI